MISDIKKWIIIAVSFSITVWLIWLTYSAWINISNVSNWNTLDASLINNLINNQNDLNLKVVPSWSVMAFNLSSCPTWWILADWTNSTPDLRWEFIRWLDYWRWIDTWRLLASAQADELKSHDHRLQTRQWWTTHTSWVYPMSAWDWTITDQWDAAIASTWWTETRPRNIALLYCMKQ